MTLKEFNAKWKECELSLIRKAGFKFAAPILSQRAADFAMTKVVRGVERHFSLWFQPASNTSSVATIGSVTGVRANPLLDGEDACTLVDALLTETQYAMT